MSIPYHQIHIDAARMDAQSFLRQYPHPVLVPETIRSGWLMQSGRRGSGTLVLRDEPGGESQDLMSPRVLVVRKKTGQHAPSSWVVLGRTAVSDVLVNDYTVSQQHARIRFARGHYELEDMGSRNGTRVDGVSIQPQVILQLSSGQVLQFGRVALSFLRPSDLYRSLRKSMGKTSSI